RLRHLVGPSVLALGMGLGAGEFLLWPNLVTVNGYEIWWLFWVGVVTQFFVIHEIERWTIATGESVFAGMARLGARPFWPWFFLVATLVSFSWPGWASESAQFTGRIVTIVTGTEVAWQPIALLMLLVIYLGLGVSTIVYNALERFELWLVIALFPLLFVVLLIVGILPGDVVALLGGAVSVGTAPPELLHGSQFPTLLIAVAYAGSGGTLLLAQSLWLRDKGFGMAAYQGRIAGIRGRNEPVSQTGYAFSAADPTALARFRAWMRIAGAELLVTFVMLCILSVVITTLVVTATLGTGNTELAGKLGEMVALQSAAIARAGGRWLEIAFLLGGVLVLFSTQIAIVDTVTRICGTVFYERYGRRTAFWTLKRTFLIFLTLLVGVSSALIVASWTGGTGLDRLQPDFLLLVAGPFTIASMFLFTLVVGAMNVSRLPAAMRPPLLTRLMLVWAAVLWGWFTAEQVSRVVLGRMSADAAMTAEIAWHPVRIAVYATWAGSVLWFAWKVLGRQGASGSENRNDLSGLLRKPAR
ncbi:MAG TPA: Nramp family divalent metal transporter, partial [Gemmatimonadales bacterium]